MENLARLVHPVDPTLAASLATEAGTTLLALGVERPPPPPLPPAPPPRPPSGLVVDSVVCAAADAIDVLPKGVRPALLAAVTRAKQLGLTLDELETALRATASA